MSKRKIAAGAAALAVFASGFEGIRYVAYNDPPGILTVCAGHTGPDVKPNIRYTKEQCDKFLEEDASDALDTVDRCAPGLPPNTRLAFGDAVFNLGETIVCNEQRSTAARLLAAGDVVAACKELPKWNKARVAGVLVPLPGLTRRRNEEMQLCLS
jgi:GH24 family phage-related lysozyme (muramidase)